MTLIGCKPSLGIEGFDQTTWSNDRYGCNGDRMQYLQLIASNQEYLLQRDQNELEGLLGLPDEHELDERRRKYFYYYFEAGPQCEGGSSYPIRLQIKFNALGLSSEVFLENN